VAGLEEEARRLTRETDFCIVGDIMCGGPFEQACWLRGYTAFLTDLYAEPAFAERLLEGITELDIGMWDAYLGAIGEHVQVVAQGDDVGMQDREYISPELYRKYIFPRHKRLYDFIHSRTRAKLFMHSCGSIRKLIPYLIEAAVDALNPVQYSAANMDLAELKREFGSELSFWGGGMDTQHALLGPGASLKSIEADVRRNMDILGKGGGFVFSATHNIQHETPPRTTLQVYDTAVRAR
jgi:uroporphyrinogen decarboxylase